MKEKLAFLTDQDETWSRDIIRNNGFVERIDASDTKEEDLTTLKPHLYKTFA